MGKGKKKAGSHAKKPDQPIPPKPKGAAIIPGSPINWREVVARAAVGIVFTVVVIYVIVESVKYVVGYDELVAGNNTVLGTAREGEKALITTLNSFMKVASESHNRELSRAKALAALRANPETLLDGKKREDTYSIAEAASVQIVEERDRLSGYSSSGSAFPPEFLNGARAVLSTEFDAWQVVLRYCKAKRLSRREVDQFRDELGAQMILAGKAAQTALDTAEESRQRHLSRARELRQTIDQSQQKIDASRRRYCIAWVVLAASFVSALLLIRYLFNVRKAP